MRADVELADGDLFTFEEAGGAERRLQFYKKYSRFLRGFSE